MFSDVFVVVFIQPRYQWFHLPHQNQHLHSLCPYHNFLNIFLVTSTVYPLHQILHCFRVGELFFRSLGHDILFTYNSRNNVSFITKICIAQTFTMFCVPYLFSKRNIRILCNAMTSFSKEKQN